MFFREFFAADFFNEDYFGEAVGSVGGTLDYLMLRGHH